MSKNPHLDVLKTRVDRPDLPVPATGIFDSPFYGKKVNAEWWKHISGVVHGLTELSAWSGDTETVNQAIDQIHAFLIEDYELMSPLDCADVEACLPSTSIAGLSRQLNMVNNAVSDDANNRRIDLWDEETPQSINENAPDWTNDNTQESINYLCVATEWFVQDFRARFTDALNFALNVGYVSQAWGVFISTISVLLSPLLSVAGGVVIWAIDVAVDEIQEIIDAFSDTLAIDEYICQLLEALQPKDTSYASYVLSLQNVLDNQTPDTNLHTIAYWFNVHCSNESVYAYFIDLLGTATECILEDDCPCIEPIECGGSTSVAENNILIGTDDPRTDSRITWGDGAFYEFSGGYHNLVMPVGGWIEFDLSLGFKAFSQSSMYISRQNSGTGNPTLRSLVDSVQLSTNTITSPLGTLVQLTTTASCQIGRVFRLENTDYGATRPILIRQLTIYWKE